MILEEVKYDFRRSWYCVKFDEALIPFIHEVSYQYVSPFLSFPFLRIIFLEIENVFSFMVEP